MLERFKTFCSVGLILLKENKVLLMKRQNTGYMDGMYALVSGHIENGESLKQGMIREAKEEVNIDIDENDLDYTCVIRRGDNCNYFNFYLKTDKYSGTIENMECEKCEELKWFDINSLPENMIVNDKKATLYNRHEQYKISFCNSNQACIRT